MVTGINRVQRIISFSSDFLEGYHKDGKFHGHIIIVTAVFHL